MEIKGVLGTSEGHIDIGKRCTSCDEFFIENIILDDFIPAEHMKDDLCFECLIVQVFIPAVEQMMVDQKNNNKQMLDVINTQKDVIHQQHEIIEGYKALILHSDLALLDMKKSEVAHGGDH